MHDEETVDLLAYVKRLARFLLPAAVVGLLVAAVLGAMALTSKEPHHVKAHVLVQPVQPTKDEAASTDPETVPRLMRTYVALEDIDQIVQAASANTKGAFTPDEVREQTEIYWGGGSMLLAVRGFATDEAKAEQLANAMAKAIVDRGPTLIDKQHPPAMSIIEPAKPDDDPTVPQPTSLPMKLVPAVGGGLVVGVITAMALELIDSRRRRRLTGQTASAQVSAADRVPADQA